MAREHLTGPDAAEVAAPADAPPAFAPAATRMLELQRSVGNRAATALVARQSAPAATATPGTVSSTTDPRMGYRAAGEADSAGLDRERLPYNATLDASRGWDWRTILDRLTQHDEQAFTFTDEVRCAANSALAIAIMYGPAQTAAFATHAANIASRRQGALARGRGATPDSARSPRSRARWTTWRRGRRCALAPRQFSAATRPTPRSATSPMRPRSR